MYQGKKYPQFFLSTESDCPYLSDRMERKVFTVLPESQGDDVHSQLSDLGFRRSQNILYRPVCANCHACLSARVVVDEFKPAQSQKRILKKNADIARTICKTGATDEQYELFETYIKTRHPDGGMADMSIEDYASMVEETGVSSRIIEYRLIENGRQGALIGACLTDILSDGLSMVYSFFDPEYSARSLGKYFILDHIKMTNSAHLDYLYLGYWVKNSPSMDYKKHIQPLELCVGGAWKPWQAEQDYEPENVVSVRQVLGKAAQSLIANKRD